MIAVVCWDTHRLFFWLPNPTERDWRHLAWAREHQICYAVYVD
jgi:hypothetical protein